MFLHRRPAMCSGRNGLFSLRGFFQHSRLCHIFSFCLSAGFLPKLRQHNYVISYCDERGGLSTNIFVNCKRSDRSAHLLHGAYEYTAEAGNRTGRAALINGRMPACGIKKLPRTAFLQFSGQLSLIRRVRNIPPAYS